MVSPFGGDGGDTLVDHTNGNQAVVEYVGLDMALTTNGGRSDGTPGSNSFREISPSCFAFTYTPSPCDPLRPVHRAVRARPREPEPLDRGRAVRLGQRPGRSRKGWNTHVRRVLLRLADPRRQRRRTLDHAGRHDQRDVVRGVVRPMQLGRLCPRDLDELWRNRSSAEPARRDSRNRFIQGLVVEKNHSNHAYVVFSGFSRRWTSTF